MISSYSTIHFWHCTNEKSSCIMKSQEENNITRTNRRKVLWQKNRQQAEIISANSLPNSPRDRSMITIAALFSAGLYPQLKSHLALGKAHGITKEEAVEIVTQLAFYCGWPKAWSTFPLIAEVWPEEEDK